MAATTAVVLGDSMGELFAYYAACDLAFVGGSLLPLGGQNLLEACAVGKPVIVGPYTFNFEEATRLAVDAGAALQVRDEQELGQVVARTARRRRAAQPNGAGRSGVDAPAPGCSAADRRAGSARVAPVEVRFSHHCVDQLIVRAERQILHDLQLEGGGDEGRHGCANRGSAHRRSHHRNQAALHRA